MTHLRQQREDTLLCFMLVIFVLLLLRILFLEAPYHFGDTASLEIASQYSPQLVKDSPSQVYFRTGMIFPFILLEQVFGYTLYSYYVFSISAYLLMISGVFFVARCLGGLSTAAISTCIAGTSSLLLYKSSVPFSDVPNLAFMLFSFGFFTWSIQVQTGCRRSVVAAAVCGFLSYLFRATNIVWLCCVPVCEMLTRRSLRNSTLYAFVFLIFLAMESLYYWVLVGDPTCRVSRIQGEVNAWSGNMPEISLTTYLFEPFAEFLKWMSGILLLFGSVPGIFLALRRRNWRLLSLTTGALTLFCAYSYTVTSWDPLRRALPLQSRYVLSFTAVLAIVTGYSCANFKEWVAIFSTRPVFRSLALFPAGIIIFVQVLELPNTLGEQALLFGKDRFLVADGMFRDQKDSVDLTLPVYAAPLRAYGFYPHFRKLEMTRLPLNKIPSAGSTLLYSRDFLRKKLNQARLPNRVGQPAWQRIAHSIEHILEHHPEWDYILDTGDIVLARVGGSG